MKRSPEKVSRRCARISSALSFFLFLSSFGRVARPYTRRIKSVESRDVAQIMRTVPVAVRHSAFSTLPVRRTLVIRFSREPEKPDGEQRHLFSGNCLKPEATGC